MKLIALIENKATGKLIGEHGLAVYIEYNGKKYLLDTGASNQFLSNADELKIDLASVDTAILSHSHYDHSGGYDGFFAKNNKAKVYLRKEARELCYAKFGLIKKYIGVPIDILDKFSDRFIYVDEEYQIDEGVWLIPHKQAGLEVRGKKAHMYRKTVNGMIADDFHHEQSLVFKTDNGLVILNSCCHAGVNNIVTEVKERFKSKEVLAVIGGFHLMGLMGTSSMKGKPEEIRTLGKSLIDSEVKYIYTGHCTGDPAYSILKEVLGEKLQYFSTGTVVEL